MNRKIITVAGGKGGVGKTNVSLHLADYLSDHSPTLLIDCDRNKTALYRAEENLKTKHPFKFKVLPHFKAADYINDFEWIIFDTQGNPNDEDLQEIARHSNLIILPTQPNTDSFAPMVKTSFKLKDTLYRFLLTLVPTYPNRSGAIAQQQLIELGLPVFKQMIRYSVGYQKASDDFTTIRHVPRFKRFWSDYSALGKEVLDLLEVG